jgi:L-2-hydroxyglutarate oxidase
VTVYGGLQADRMAAMCGIGLDFRIVPFRGEYFRLPDSKNEIVKYLIYPVPDPKLLFLGVHLTPMIGSYVTVGPNAVLALARAVRRRPEGGCRAARLSGLLAHHAQPRGLGRP